MTKTSRHLQHTKPAILLTTAIIAVILLALVYSTLYLIPKRHQILKEQQNLNQRLQTKQQLISIRIAYASISRSHGSPDFNSNLDKSLSSWQTATDQLQQESYNPTLISDLDTLKQNLGTTCNLVKPFTQVTPPPTFDSKHITQLSQALQSIFPQMVSSPLKNTIEQLPSTAPQLTNSPSLNQFLTTLSSQAQSYCLAPIHDPTSVTLFEQLQQAITSLN